MGSKAQAIKRNVSRSQADKHVNKTYGAAGGGWVGEEMGRAHPHSRLHPPRRSAPRHASARSHTPPRWPPSASRPAPPAPAEVLGLQVGTQMGTFVRFVFRERQEPAGKE